MRDQAIEKRACFNIICYAQVWEDADILTCVFAGVSGRRFLSVAAAGDNTLAMLILDPSEIVAVDLSSASHGCNEYSQSCGLSWVNGACAINPSEDNSTGYHEWFYRKRTPFWGRQA